MITEVQRKKIKSLINNHRHYDRKRFGTSDNTITYEGWLELYIEQQGRCWWTGIPMTIGEGLPSDASLDRLHCDLPHTLDNTVLVHRAVNLGRNDSSLKDWALYLHSCGLLAAEHVRDLQAIDLLIDNWE